MKLNVAVLVLLLFSSVTKACDLYSNSFLEEGTSSSVMFQASGICFSMLDGIDYASAQLSALGLTDDNKSTNSLYWSDWVLKTDDDPIFTQKLATSYIGFGVWMPQELHEEKSKMSTEEWLMSHGIQISFGFGEKKVGEPRMRIDYRWHEDYDLDVMMQIEVPF